MNLHPAILVFLTAAVCSACTSAPVRPTSPSTDQPEIVRPVISSNSSVSLENTNQQQQPTNSETLQSSTGSATSPAPRPTNPAARALRSEAEAALKINDLPTASRLLERALRIDPRDAATFLALAQLRALQNQPRAAEQLIDKGLSLRPDTDIEKQLNALAKGISTQ